MPSQMVRAHEDLPAPDPADQQWIRSHQRWMRAAGRAESTRNIYRLAVSLLARWAASTGRPSLERLKRGDIQEYMIWMAEQARTREGKPFASGYQHNQWRTLKTFYLWLVTEMEEDGEAMINPMKRIEAPPLIVPEVPVIEDEDMVRLLKSVEKGKDFDSRRDYAIILLFLTSGVRIEELTMLTLDQLDLDRLRVTVVGKGRNGKKVRTVRFDARTGTAIDRYLRLRVKHRFAGESNRLWLPTPHKKRPLTTSGVRCMITRRATAVELKINPHMFRHTFTHNFLVRGGEEGDLLELNGWTTGQMLNRYGRSKRSARAQSNYDRVMGPGR